MKQNKYLEIAILLVILLVTSISVYYWREMRLNKGMTSQSIDVVKPSTQVKTNKEKSELEVTITDDGIYRNEKYGFQLHLPKDWIASREIIKSPDNKYVITFAKLNLNEVQGSETIELYRKDKIREAEQKNIQNMCKETDSCAKIVSWQSAIRENGEVAMFTIRYPGVRIDEPRGFIDEYHETIKLPDSVYKFWISEVNPPSELKKEYPVISPSPSKMLEQIMETFSTI
jgi:hypothetical protein